MLYNASFALSGAKVRENCAIDEIEMIIFQNQVRGIFNPPSIKFLND